MAFPLVGSTEEPQLCPKCGGPVKDTGHGTYVCENAEVEDCNWWIKHEDWSPETQIELMGISIRRLRGKIADLHEDVNG